MKTITVTYAMSTVCSESIEVQDDFELKNPESCHSWDELCYRNPEIDFDLASDSDDSDLDLDVISMDVTDKDGESVFTTCF
jgi:hypothetical protein